MLVLGELERNWKWLLALGIFFTLSGIIGILTVPVVTITTVITFGVFMQIGGILQIVNGFKMREWKSITLHIIIGIIYILGGLVAVINPILASMVLTLLLAFSIISIGAVRIAVSIQNKDAPAWYMGLISGILSVALGMSIALQWPWSSISAIGVIISVDLLMNGWANISLALAVRKLAKSQ